MRITATRLTLGGKIALVHLLCVNSLLCLFRRWPSPWPAAPIDSWYWQVLAWQNALLGFLFLPMGLFFEGNGATESLPSFLVFVTLWCSNSFVIGYGIEYTRKLFRR